MINVTHYWYDRERDKEKIRFKINVQIIWANPLYCNLTMNISMRRNVRGHIESTKKRVVIF